MLFYDINNHQIISCGAIDAISKRKITEVNSTKPLLFSNKLRIEKLKYFIRYITNSKSVKVYKNTLLWKLKFLKRRIKMSIKKINNNNIKDFLFFTYNTKKMFNLKILLNFINIFFSYCISVLFVIFMFSLIKYKYNYLSLIIILIILFILINLMSLKISKNIDKRIIYNIKKEVNNSIINDKDNLDNLSVENILKSFNSIINSYTKLFASLLFLLIIMFIDFRFSLILSIFIFINFNILNNIIINSKVYTRNYYSVGKIVTFSKSVINNEITANRNTKLFDIMIWFELVVLIFVSIYYIKSNILITLIIMLLLYDSPFINFFHEILYLSNQLDNFKIICNKVLSLINNDVYLNEIYGHEYKNKCDGNIEFKNVKFKYDNKCILNNISFKVSNNEVFVINKDDRVILDLITRLYYVDSGEVLIDGLSLNKYDYKFIRENISVINQNPYLFNMSIKDNFRLIKEDITDEEIYKVCKLVYLDKCIDELPNKYDTIIGNGGIELDGCCKQRLSLARAIVKNTKILLIDELEYKEKDNYDLIMKIINKIKKNHTIVMVSNNK